MAGCVLTPLREIHQGAIQRILWPGTLEIFGRDFTSTFDSGLNLHPIHTDMFDVITTCAPTTPRPVAPEVHKDLRWESKRKFEDVR